MKQLSFALICVLAFAAVFLPAASADVWTEVADADALEAFFMEQVWPENLTPANIEVVAGDAGALPGQTVNTARAAIMDALPELVTVPAEDEHLSTAGDLYVQDAFSVYLLTQDCDSWDEVGYFTYKIEDGALFIGEAGVVYPIINKYSGPALGSGRKVTLQQDYDGFVQIGFFIRNTRNQYWAYHTSEPLAQTIFTVSEFNDIPGKKWYKGTAQEPISTTTPVRSEFSYIFDESTAQELFPAFEKPVMLAFEDCFWTDYVDGWRGDWDYNDVVIVTDPVFRSVQTNEPSSSSISGLVWVDDNRDGIRNETEQVLDSVRVYLLDEDGGIVAVTTTDVDGTYHFTHLEPGTYFVQFDVEDDWVVSPIHQGDDATRDSDADEATGRTAAIVVEAGDHHENVDMGVFGATADDLCIPLGIAANFNALIFGDFNATGGDTEGRLAIAGNADFNTAGYSVGIAVKGNRVPYLGGDADMLIVGGGTFADGNFEVNGNIVYAGERSGPNRDFSQLESTMRQVNPITFDAAGNVVDDGSGFTFDYLLERMILRSAVYADKLDRGVVAKERPDQWSGIQLIGEDPELNVFNVTAEEWMWEANAAEIRIQAPEGSTVLVNITGEEISFQNGRITLVGVDAERVLYNYVNATNITTIMFEHEGSVLAPFADWTFQGAAINGRAVIGGNVVMTVGSEFHNFDFLGEVCVDARTIPSYDPAISLVFTLNGAVDGSVLQVGPGTAITNEYLIINQGVSALSNIVLVDDDLGEVFTSTNVLLPGASILVSAIGVSSAVEGAAFRAEVTADPVNRLGESLGLAAVSAVDSATFEVVENLPDPNVPNPDYYKPDFAVTKIEYYGDAPTMPGDIFNLNVTVMNRGDVAGDAGTLAFFTNAPNALSLGSTGDSTQEIGLLSPYQYAVLQVTGLVAGEAGTYTLRAFADVNNITAEWNDVADNQLGFTYTIEDLRADLGIVDMYFFDENPAFAGEAPTLAGQPYRVAIVVTNSGQLPVRIGNVAIYYNQAKAFGADMPTTPDDYLWVPQTLAPGKVTSAFGTGKIWPAASARGVFHPRAVVNPAREYKEWSYGDNELSLTYFASVPALQSPVAPAEGLPREHTIAWTAFAGDTYRVEASTNLMSTNNSGFETVVEGLAFGSSEDGLDPAGSYYFTEGVGMYFFDANTYDGQVTYRIVVEAAPAQTETSSRSRSLQLK